MQGIVEKIVERLRARGATGGSAGSVGASEDVSGGTLRTSVGGSGGSCATLAVAESCTGGRIAAALTASAGASEWFAGGVIAYSNEVKINVLGVSREAIETHGAVSRQVAEAMARGVRTLTGADFAIATTGIAGPGGGSAGKPVGTVWIAVAGPAVSSALETTAVSSEAGETKTIAGSAETIAVSSEAETIAREFHFVGERTQIMEQAVETALVLMTNY